ncbi:MAG: helix-turn-helix domain-containing protein [Kofleriaceae bacterium]
MSDLLAIEAGIRALVRDVVREEIRTALHEHRTERRNSSGGSTGDSYVSIARAATIADVAPGTLRRWIKSGRLPAHRAGRVYRIPRNALDEFLRTGRSAEVVDKALEILRGER